MATIDNLSIQVTASAESAASALDRLASSAGRLRGAASQAVGGLRNLSAGAKDAGTATQEAGQQAGNAEKHTRDYGRAAQEAGNAAKRGTNGISSFWQAITGTVGVIKKVTGVSGFAQNALGMLGNSFGSIGHAISKYGIMGLSKFFGDKLVSSIKKPIAAIGNFVAGIKRIAYYRIIRTIIKEITQGINEGMKSLYAWSKTADGTFKKTMDGLAASTKYLGNSFAAMISPLINALSPAIDFIVDKFVDMFNIVNQFFARLTGSNTYTAAKKIASEWSDAGDKTKKAADSMKRSILGFDEINKLDSKSAAGSGNNNTGANASNMFETRTIEGEIYNFADKLKSMFEDSDWRGIGTTIGDKINDAINGINWKEIGEKTGKFLNSIIVTANSLLSTINFENIGSKIAEFLNNAIKEISWEDAAGLIVNGLTAIPDLMIGFLDTFDFGNFAIAFGSFVKNFFDKLTAWIESKDWKKIGENVVNGITDFIENTDWIGIVKSVIKNIAASIKASTEFLLGVLKGAWNKLTEENMDKSIFEIFVEWFNGLWKDFKKAAESTWDSLKEIGSGIWAKITEGISGSVKGIGDWIKNHIFKPFVDAWHWILGIFGGNDKEVDMTVKTNVVTNTETALGGGGVKQRQVMAPPALDDEGAAIVKAGITMNAGVSSSANNIGQQIIEGTDTETVRQLKELGSSMGKAIKQGIFDAISGIANEIWDKIVDGWTIDDSDFTVTVESKVIKGEWDDTAWLAANMTSYSATRKITSVIKKGQGAQWNKDAWAAANMTSYSPTRKITVAVQKGEWNDAAWTGANMTSYSPTRKITVVVQKGAWNDAAWTGANMTPYSPMRKITVVVQKGTWNDAAWIGANMTSFSPTRTITVVVQKGLWNSYAWAGANMTSYSPTRTITVVVQKGLWNSDAWAGANMTSFSPTRTITVVVQKGAWNGEAWEAAHMTSYSPTRTITAVVQKGTWDSEAWKAVNLNSGSKTVSVGVNLTENNTNTTGSNLWEWWKNTFVKNTQYEIDIITKLLKGWNTNTPQEAVGVSDLESTIDVGLQQNWLGDPVAFVGAVNLKSDIKADLVRSSGWATASGGTLGYLGLNDLKATITAQIAIDKKKNKVVATFDGGGSGVGTWSLQTKAKGGIFSGGVWRSIAQYASGTLDALHGSLFLAGEAGPEIVGHVGGRTEVLNKSQLASAMYSAVQAAMAPAAANFAAAASNMSAASVSIDLETLAEMVRQGVEQAMRRTNDLDLQRNEYLRQINEKDFTAEVSTAEINNAQRRMNRRAGTTIVPVGT